MLPDNKLSTFPVAASFLVPTRRDANVDYEYGGIRLRDTTQGLQYQLWRSEYVDGSILLVPERTGSRVSVVNRTGVIHHSFAFDQNMNPCVVYKVGLGSTFMYWYDPVAGSQQTLELDGTIEYPQVTLDDNRQFNLGSSDIILSYIRDGKLYYRLQRERYLQEHFLEDTPDRKLTQTGMTRNLRFRWRHVRKKQGD